jgi:hypothetical protein
MTAYGSLGPINRKSSSEFYWYCKTARQHVLKRKEIEEMLYEGIDNID